MSPETVAAWWMLAVLCVGAVFLLAQVFRRRASWAIQRELFEERQRVERFKAMVEDWGRKNRWTEGKP